VILGLLDWLDHCDMGENLPAEPTARLLYQERDMDIDQEPKHIPSLVRGAMVVTLGNTI
jgi:hypothetical protein